MSELMTENYIQGMDRLVRLAVAMPDTQMTLIDWAETGRYTVVAGTMGAELVNKSTDLGGRVVLSASWNELLLWWDRIADEKAKRKGNGDTQKSV